MNNTNKPLRIAITTGEPAGIGPELMYHLSTQDPSQLKLTARTAHHQECIQECIQECNQACNIELVLIGDQDLLQQRMAIWGGNFKLQAFEQQKFQPSTKGVLSCLHTPLGTQSVPGVLDSANAQYVLNTLDIAIQGCLNGTFDALVTGPISKSIICSLGLPLTGHTEYLQEQTNTKEVVMMLGCEAMNVALVTTHLPIQDISKAITKEKLKNIIHVLHTDLQQKMGFKQPKIYICGLNPHAGENGTLGTEEIETIIPVIEELKQQGMDLYGPLPADTIFQKCYLDEASAILAMYHDQGLPVLKYVGFDQGYNTTLGLPFIRTSVDHGTALNLANKAQADGSSLKSAVSLAIYMAQHNKKL